VTHACQASVIARAMILSAGVTCSGDGGFTANVTTFVRPGCRIDPLRMDLLSTDRMIAY
jgi:hypothetical protein